MLFYPAALPLSSRTLNYTAGVIRRYRTGDTVLVCETVEDLFSADPVLSACLSAVAWRESERVRARRGHGAAAAAMAGSPSIPGATCAECCWGLMTVLVAVGVMNVGHGGAGSVIFVEKLSRYGKLSGETVGVATGGD